MSAERNESMPNKYTSCYILLILFLGGVTSGEAVQMKPFAIDWRDNADSLVDLSFLLDAPAGKNGFLRTTDGHLAKLNGEAPKGQLDLWLTLNLGTEILGAWIAYENDKAIGFIICEIVEPENPKTYISFNWVKPGISVNSELLAEVEKWSREKDIHTLVCFTKKSPVTYIKKHGFNLVRSVLDKEV